MSSLGTFLFMVMTGEKLQVRSPLVEIVVRPGVDGEIYREDPVKARVFEENTVTAVSTLAQANALARQYVASKALSYTVVDDYGDTFYNVLVMDVQNIEIRRVLSPSVSGYNFLVSARWWLKPTQ